MKKYTGWELKTGGASPYVYKYIEVEDKRTQSIRYLSQQLTLEYMRIDTGKYEEKTFDTIESALRWLVAGLDEHEEAKLKKRKKKNVKEAEGKDLF